MTLRCQPGDLCVVLKAPRGMQTEGLIGAFVTVTSTYPCPCCGDPLWLLEKPVDCAVLLGGGWVEARVPAVADEYLQPIRRGREPEATPTTVDKPKPVEA